MIEIIEHIWRVGVDMPKFAVLTDRCRNVEPRHQPEKFNNFKTELF